MSGYTLQETNDDLINWETAHFQGRYEPQFALAQAMALPLGMSQLRGFWPMSSVDENGDVYDLSGQGRTLTNNNASSFGVSGLAPYVEFNGTTQNLTRADEVGISITGALTLWGWFNSQLAATRTIFAKSLLTTGAGRGAFGIQHSNSIAVAASVINGVSSSAVTSSDVISTNEWAFVAMRFTPSTELAIFLNGVKTVNTTSIIASIGDDTNPLVIGAESDGAGGYIRFDGRIHGVNLCADSLSDAVIFAMFEQSRAAFNV